MTINTGISLVNSPYAREEENMDTVNLHDLLCHADLEYIVQLNFLVDLTYLISHLHPKVLTSGKVPMVVIYGSTDPDTAQRVTKEHRWVRLIEPKLRDRYGSHHTKAMILFFNTDGNKSAQIVIMTANMVQGDWDLMTQGVYRTPRCPLKAKKEPRSPVAGSIQGVEFGSPFERDMSNYLRGYDLPVLNEVAHRLRFYDWSACKAILIGSIPGRHKGPDLKKWGMLRLAQVLQDHVQLPEQCCQESSIVIQCSSIASLTLRFLQTLERCLSSANNADEAHHVTTKLVYPTIDTVAQSRTGLLDSGGFLRLDESVYEKQRPWFEEHMVEWTSYTVGRQYLMPHIKTFTRIYLDTHTNKYAMAWFLLTSHNLSRAAWGDLQVNDTQLYIKSYELGVLLVPSLWETNVDPYIEMMPSTLFDPSPSNLPGVPVVPIRLPYDLPLNKQSSPCFVRRPYY